MVLLLVSIGDPNRRFGAGLDYRLARSKQEGLEMVPGHSEKPTAAPHHFDATTLLAS